MHEPPRNNFTVQLMPQWAPIGVDRVVQLAEAQFFDNMPFFRALPNFLVQFGIPVSKEKFNYWNRQGNIQDDPPANPKIPFTDGIVSFAGYGDNSRGTHLFFALGDQPGLGSRKWEVPVGRTVEGMDVIHSIYTGYGDSVDQRNLSPNSPGSAQYLRKFPKLDRILGCDIIHDDSSHLNAEL